MKKTKVWYGNPYQTFVYSQHYQAVIRHGYHSSSLAADARRSGPEKPVTGLGHRLQSPAAARPYFVSV